MRIFLGLTEVSGFYTNLKKGFDSIGVKSELITLTHHPFNYGSNNQSVWVRMSQYAMAGKLRNKKNFVIKRIFWSILVFVTRLFLLIWALLRFDVFMFCCATSFFRFRELPLLKFLGKKIIYNFHGTDSRCAFMDGFAEDLFMPSNFKEGTGYIGPLRDWDDKDTKFKKVAAYVDITAFRKTKVDYIDKYADVIINSPSHGQHHSRPFIQRLIIGMPYMPERRTIKLRKKNYRFNDQVTILHCPSYPEGKGSPEIRLAINSLIKKGYKIKFIEITGRPNQEVLELISTCDFVIDQLYSDMAMVGFATEAAFFGKPAIVGGYYSRNQLNDIPSKWIPPTLFCLPEDIETAIKKMLIDKNYRQDLGNRAHDFVTKYWHASECAKRIIDLIYGNIPKDWFFDPHKSDYYLGMGMKKDKVKQIMSYVVSEYGVNALKLSDKPVLEQKILNFVKN